MGSLEQEVKALNLRLNQFTNGDSETVDANTIILGVKDTITFLTKPYSSQNIMNEMFQSNLNFEDEDKLNDEDMIIPNI